MLAEQRNDHARQHVSAAACGKAGVAGVVDISIQTVHDHRPAALEQHDSVAPRCKAHRLPGPVIRLRVAAQPQKFPVMRGQHDRTGTSAQNIYMSRDGVYAIRVQNQRRAAAQQDRLHEPRQLLRAAEARTEQHCVHIFQTCGDRRQRRHAEPSFLVAGQRKDDLAPGSRRYDRIDLFRHAEIYQTASRAERARCPRAGPRPSALPSRTAAGPGRSRPCGSPAAGPAAAHGPVCLRCIALSIQVLPYLLLPRFVLLRASFPAVPDEFWGSG